MKSENTTKTITRFVALGALFLIPFTPLIVADSFFFPFITGKAFFFRILVEVALGAWAILACLDKEYRPRVSWIGISIIAFVAWMFIADSFALNATKAFWSNFERMEGWVMLVHLLGFFFSASAILRAEKKWRAWFLTSISVAIIISVYSLLQLAGVFAIHQGSIRIDASLGNSAYLGIYLLFTVCVALWLALTEKYAWLKYSLLALAVLDTVLIFFTETRGTIIGLVIAFSLAALLTVLTAGKRARLYAVGGLIAILLLVGGFYLARNTEVVQGNHVLERIASISLADGSTRFTIWNMALKGVAERPIIGWGQEGFNYIFNSYYDPSLYAQEPWFDRAHNAFIDWLTAGGVPAFLFYISIFATALLMLWKSSELSRPERILLTAALVGYAIHNLFVFDNIYSYVYFFALLALIDSQVSKPCKRIDGLPVISVEDSATYIVPIVIATTCVLVWFVNVPGMQTASNLIKALSPSPTGINGNIASFESLAQNHSFAGQEVREQIVSFAASAVQSKEVTVEQKQKILTLAVTEMQKQVDAYPLDARERLQLSYVYRTGGADAEALREVQKAIELSPKKEQMWIEAGVIEWGLGNLKAVQQNFNTAYALGPQFTDLAVYAAAGNIAVGDMKSADEILKKNFGTVDVDNNILSVAYYRTKNWPRLIAVWKIRAEKQDATVEDYFSLASAYYASGDSAGALETVDSAIKRFPEASTSGAQIIAEIKKGGN